MTALRLGKKAARKGAISFKFADFFDAKKLPTPPASFGHYGLVKNFYGLGNDRAGNCLAEGTIVSASGVNGAFKAPYRGDMVTLETASGKRLTVTSKHSLLTREGFASADSIKQGDYLVGARGAQELPRLPFESDESDRYRHPSAVEEVFRSLSFRFGSARKIMPRAVDFHGDEKFINGNIEVVSSECFLRSKMNASLRQPHTQDKVCPAGQLESSFIGPGSLVQSAWRCLFASDSDIRFGSNGPSFSYAHSGISEAKSLTLGAKLMPSSLDGFLQISARDILESATRFFKRRAAEVKSNSVCDVPVFSLGDEEGGFFGSSSRPKASINHPAFDGHYTDPHFFCDLADAFPGFIELDRVVNVDIKRDVRTHVYDLSTDSRWYLADGIVSHNCVWAGGAHETMIWSMEGGRPRSRFTIKSVLSDYSDVTGFDPKKPETDQGTDMQAAASYRRKTGILDAQGVRHKIDSYVALEIGNVEQLVLAMWLMGAAGIGLQMPQEAMTAFDAGQVWDVTAKPHIVGGHYVPGVGRDKNGNILVVTWGKVQAMTPAFYSRFCDEAVAYISLEILNDKNLSPEGFDADSLRAHLANLSK